MANSAFRIVCKVTNKYQDINKEIIDFLINDLNLFLYFYQMIKTLNMNKRPLFRIIVVIIISLFFSINTSAQQKNIENKGSFKDRIFLGGNLGLQFGTITLIEISPLLGYKITDDFSAGIGFTYQYYKDTRFNPDYSTNIFGGRIFARYYIYQDFFAHSEVEVLNYDAYYWPSNDKDNITITNVLVGGGYNQHVSQRASVSIMILWNLNEDINSLYSNPIFRVGFNVGL